MRGELDWIVMKALEKDRARRYETAVGFGRDIERYLNDEAVEACEATKGLVDYRSGRFAAAAGTILRLAPARDGGRDDAAALAVLAMADQRLGKPDDARAALASAQNILATKMPKTERGETFDDDDWHFWVHAQVLCREGETLLAERQAP